MELVETACVFCEAPVSYALLDPSVTQHPGYAPVAETAGDGA